MNTDSTITVASVAIRRLWPADRAALVGHFLALDTAGRHSRFGRAVSDVFLEGYAEKAIAAGNVIHGAFDAGVLCAVCEVQPTGQGVAEAAFSVLDHYRHHGLASQLMDRALTAAGNRGIERLIMLCVSDNEPMRQLARKFGAEMVHSRGEVVGEIVPPGVSPVTLFEETFQDAAGLFLSFLMLPLAYAPGGGSQPS